jgi:hypothetical protein
MLSGDWALSKWDKHRQQAINVWLNRSLETSLQPSTPLGNPLLAVGGGLY